MNEINNHNQIDDIDILDIINVVIKRKWVVVTLTLLALVLSSIYVIMSEIRYTANIIVASPQQYKIGKNRLLLPSPIPSDNYLYTARNELTTISSELAKEQKATSFTYDVQFIKQETIDKYLYTQTSGVARDAHFIYIRITGHKEQLIETANSLYFLFTRFQNEVGEKNQKIFEKNQDALAKNIQQKREIQNTITSYIKNVPFKSPEEPKAAMVTSLTTLDSIITISEETFEANEILKLMNGSFVMIKGDSEKDENILLNNSNLHNIASYIFPEKSRKRYFLPIIASVFLTFIASIFLSFVINFFSREDVKKRLGEVKNK